MQDQCHHELSSCKAKEVPDLAVIWLVLLLLSVLKVRSARI